MKRSTMVVTVLLAMIVVFGMMVVPAMAQVEGEVKILAGEDEKPVTDAAYVPDVFDIGVNGELFFRIRADAAGFSAAERARIINARIVHIISFAPVNPEAVRVVPVRGKPTIYVGNVRLVTVYPSDVEATGAESMQRLANIWAASTACCLRNIAPWSRIEKE
ncbi:MAG: hypothetical protein ACOX9R_08930 [Armatimonadota bacterium]|jgi:hypothetical protein